MFSRLLSMCIAAWLGAEGCAAPVLTAAELEYRSVIDQENWTLCQAAYKQAGKHMVHEDNSGDPNDHRSQRAIRQDLAVNQCSRVLGDYWAGY